MEDNKEKSLHTQNVLQQILQTINRQVLGLAFAIACFNVHQLIEKPEEKPHTINYRWFAIYRECLSVRELLLVGNKILEKFSLFSVKGNRKIFFPTREIFHPSGFECVGESSPKVLLSNLVLTLDKGDSSWVQG